MSSDAPRITNADADAPVLFAGGPMDGQVLALAEKPPSFEWPSGPNSFVRYRRLTFAHGDSREEFVYVVADTQCPDVVLEDHVRSLMRRRAATSGND